MWTWYSQHITHYTFQCPQMNILHLPSSFHLPHFAAFISHLDPIFVVQNGTTVHMTRERISTTFWALSARGCRSRDLRVSHTPDVRENTALSTSSREVLEEDEEGKDGLLPIWWVQKRCQLKERWVKRRIWTMFAYVQVVLWVGQYDVWSYLLWFVRL